MPKDFLMTNTLMTEKVPIYCYVVKEKCEMLKIEHRRRTKR